MSDRYMPLAETETCRDRPFTAPEHSRADVEHLRHIAVRLREALRRAGAGAAGLRHHVLRVTEPDGRVLRLVIGNGAELLRPAPRPVVGFFGQRRSDAEYSPIGRVDEELLEEFLQHPHIIAYCSLELPSTNWGNLVVMSNPDAPQHWGASERHRYAARELAPRYYAAVRIHNAELPAGVMGGDDLLLNRTKYYDYETSDHWRGWRELTPPQRFRFV